MHQDLSWQRLIHNWSDAELRFALQATTDTAPTATNLRRWGVSEVDPACIMCGKPATLRYVLNGCPVALHQGRYTWRHNSVLSEIRHRLNTFWEQRSTKVAVQATVSTREKARYIQFVRAGQRLPAPNHITQRKPLASQAILLQANDWTFLYDLEGQLQFPIEAAVTSLRPDVVLFSRSSKTIVLLKLTVPLEDSVHLAHDRKTTKYSALVTACEENGFKTHMFALEVGCLGYCPHFFLHCFEALGLPKSAASQIRSEASKTALRSSYVLFLRRGMPTWECQAVLCWTMLTSRSFRFFLSSFALPFPFRTVRTPRQLVLFPSIHTTPPRFSNSSTVRRRLYRHRTQLRTPVFRALPSGLNFRAASRLRSVSSSLRGLNDACAGRRLVDLCF